MMEDKAGDHRWLALVEEAFDQSHVLGQWRIRPLKAIYCSESHGEVSLQVQGMRDSGQCGSIQGNVSSSQRRLRKASMDQLHLLLKLN